MIKKYTPKENPTQATGSQGICINGIGSSIVSPARFSKSLNQNATAPKKTNIISLAAKSSLTKKDMGRRTSKVTKMGGTRNTMFERIDPITGIS
jgi:hypothetical protein